MTGIGRNLPRKMEQPAFGMVLLGAHGNMLGQIGQQTCKEVGKRPYRLLT